MTTKQMFGQHGLQKTLQKRAMVAVLEGKMSSHLGYAPPHLVPQPKWGGLRKGGDKILWHYFSASTRYQLTINELAQHLADFCSLPDKDGLGLIRYR